MLLFNVEYQKTLTFQKNQVVLFLKNQLPVALLFIKRKLWKNIWLFEKMVIIPRIIKNK